MADLYLVVDREAYKIYAAAATDQYGDLFDLEEPETFPCIIYEDFWPGDCSPDSLIVLAIEKKHFDGPPYWNEFDIVYR